MTIILTRKDTKQPCYFHAHHITTWNSDTDGTGSILILVNGTIRTVVENPDAISKLIKPCKFF